MKHTPLKVFGKPLIACTVALMSLSGCTGQTESDRQKGIDLLFSGVNHILDARTLSLSGTVSAYDTEYSCSLEWIQGDDLQMALKLAQNDSSAAPVEFYVKDGKTYLNYQGTTSQSTLANLGLKPDVKFSSFSPFLDMSKSQRDDCFEEISQDDENTWTYHLNLNKLSALFDSYGTLQFSEASLTVSYDEASEIQDLSFKFDGSIAFTAQPIPVDVQGSLHVDSLNGDLKIQFDPGLEAYGTD